MPSVAWKYWLKFSSPESTVPHGVIPPAQLLRVPSTRLPVGSAVVRRRRLPAPGGSPPGAVVGVPEPPPAGRVGRRAQAPVAGRRSGHPEGGRRGDAAVAT